MHGTSCIFDQVEERHREDYSCQGDLKEVLVKRITVTQSASQSVLPDRRRKRNTRAADECSIRGSSGRRPVFAGRCTARTSEQIGPSLCCYLHICKVSEIIKQLTFTTFLTFTFSSWWDGITI